MTEGRKTPRRQGWPGWALIAATALSLGAIAAPAPAATGGAGAPQKPQVKSVTCVEGCAGLDRVTIGGRIQVNGRHLGKVTKVVFAGGASAPVAVKGPQVIEAQVPDGASSGPVAVEDDYGSRSAPSRKKLEIERAAKLFARSQGRPVIQLAQSASNRFYYGARRRGTFRYLISSDGPVTTRVDAIRQEDGAVIRSWLSQNVAPFKIQEIEWDGTDGAGAVQREGRYTFKLHVVDELGAAASRSEGPADGTDGISFFRHVFPIRGPHDYGHGGAEFGAGRSGHSHQGQDVFARCGTPLVAARGGTVKWNAFHSAAGHYVVIDGADTDVDYVYMHLRERSPLRKGERVYTGQRVGEVGDTGRASGCHLHFELWSGPGWYDGGSPFDPAPELRAWDAYS